MQLRAMHGFVPLATQIRNTVLIWSVSEGMAHEVWRIPFLLVVETISQTESTSRKKNYY